MVFDASVHPGDFALDAHYRGLGILFALGDENADARIEQLIAADSDPRTLTVVSSDRRIRHAAVRRRTKSLTADQYWELIDDFKERSRIKTKTEVPSNQPRPHQPADDSAHWLEAFRDVDDLPEILEALTPNHALLTDAEIAEIEREVEREL